MAAICARGMPRSDELVGDLLVGRVAPGRGVHPHVAEGHLRAAGGCRAVPDGGDLLHQGVQLRAGVVRGGPGEHPGVEGELSAVGRDGERVVVAGVHLLRPQAVVAGHELTLERCLFVRHRAGDDDGLPGLEARAGEVQHLGRLHVGKRPKHLLQLGQVREFGKAAPGAERRPVGGDFHRVDHLAESRRPGRAETTSRFHTDLGNSSIVPLGEKLVEHNLHGLLESRGILPARLVHLVKDAHVDLEALLRFGLRHVVPNGLERVEDHSATRPGQVGEQAVLNRIPLRAVRRVVGHANLDAKPVRQLLKVFFEQIHGRAIAAAAIA